VKSRFSFVRPLLFTAAAAIAFGACDESLNGGAACPALCPSQQVALRDTTFFAVDFDTAIAGFPALGSELRHFLAAFGDTLETAMIVRFDSLPNRFNRINVPEDSAILAVDSAYIRLTVVRGDTASGLATTVDVYDVDMGGAEEADPTSVTSQMIPSRLIGTRTIPADSLRDSLRIPIDNAKLLEKIQDTTAIGKRLRVAIRVRDGSAMTKLTVIAQDGAGNPHLVFRPSVDTAVPKLTVLAFSRTPADNFELSLDMADYLAVIRGPAAPSSDVFRLGGLPGSRAYLRFDIPSRILDSSAVVRATLELTQRPAPRSSESRDTVGVAFYGVVATPVLTDLSRALLFILPGRADTANVAPADSGVRQFEIIDWVRVWRGTTAAKAPRALALAIQEEGTVGSIIDFFSTEAAATVRPRLRLTYLPKTEATVP
jgi:hypothetical protein